MAVNFAGYWQDIFNQLIPHVALPTGPRTKHGPCCIVSHPGQSKDGFRFFKDWQEQGGGMCNTCGPFPNGVKVLAGVLGIDEREAFRQAALVVEDLQGGKDRPHKPYVPPEIQSQELSPEEKAKRKASIDRVIKWSKPFENSPAQAYLQGRGLDCMPQSDVFYNNSMIYAHEDDSQEKHPAMVSLFRNPSGEVITIHRTYITLEGKKAPVPKVKKVMSGTEILTGGAIRLFPINDQKRLGISEGIETALAASEITGIPTWACYSNTVLEGFVPPDQITHLYIFADHDLNGAGQNSAKKLVERLASIKPELKVIVFLPPNSGEKVDWLDWLTQQRYEMMG